MQRHYKMHQPATNRRVNEIGAAMCRTPDGRLVFGPWSEGTPTSVSINPVCPPGSKLFGIYHTHPGGIPVPSERDLDSGRRIDATTLCINADGDLRCHNLI